MRPGRDILLLGLAAYAVLQVRGRRSQSTWVEREVELPGDELVRHPQLVTDHAATIHAPPEQVWPWLTQLGWHRAGWYTPRWVDRLLFPDNGPSLDWLDPRLVHELREGEGIPDGPPGTAEYVVAQVAAPQLLVLRSTTHLPPGWARLGATIDWTWTFRLTAVQAGRATRLHLRVRGRMAPWWVLAVYHAVVVPAEAVMAPGMLRGLRRRVEQTSRVEGVAV